MNDKDLTALIEKVCRIKCETGTIEIKSAKKGTPEKLYDSLSSFSNQDEGGTIIFGIDEKIGFKPVGVYDPQDLIRRISEQCRQMVPPVRANITSIEYDGKNIVAAEIPGVDFSERPVFYGGAGRIKGSYVRVGDADIQMTEYEVYSIDAYKRRIKDDSRIIEGATLGDLDPEKTALLILKAKIERPQFSKLSDNDILERLGIIKDGTPTLSGLLITGKYPQGLIPQYSITAVVIPGYKMGQTGESGERFTANKRFCGTIDEMLEEARLFVSRNMRVKTIIKDGKRADKDEYPLNAVREAILNALMHRDYSFRTEGTPIQILMYYDRMEIISPGGLFGRLTVDTLGKGRADTRNSCLASLLEIIGICENRFSGIPTIRREFADAALPEPLFNDTRNDFIVTFYNEQGQASSAREQQYSFSTQEKSKGFFASDNLAVYADSGITCSEDEQLLKFCRTPRSRQEIAEFFGFTQYYAVKTYILPLVKKGLLRPTLPQLPKSKRQRYVSEVKLP